ncbi:MAG: hypothetical protein WAM72_04705, partial [Xanthobacteraceae bacterium]
MTEPDTEHPAGPVTLQTPVVSNYGLVLTVYILYLVGFLTGITFLVGVVIAYLQRDRTSVFFYWDFDAALFNRHARFALVGRLD